MRNYALLSRIDKLPECDVSTPGVSSAESLKLLKLIGSGRYVLLLDVPLPSNTLQQMSGGTG